MRRGKDNLPILDERPGEKRLQDVPGEEALIIRGTISPALNISLQYKQEGEIAFKELSFQLHERTRYGFLVYRLELNEEDVRRDYVCECLSREMHKAFYHYIKGFFHKHMFHTEAEDSLLPAFFSTTEIQWDQPSTRANILLPIIETYSHKFSGFLEEWNDYLNLALEEISGNKNVSKNIELLHDLIRDAPNVFGEARYCEFLLQNFPKEISKNKKALIRSTITSLKSLHGTLSFWYEYYSSKVSFLDGQKGVRVGVWGIVVGVVSLLFTCYLEYTSPDFVRIEEENKRYTDSLYRDSRQWMERDAHLDKIRFDSIQNNLQGLRDLLEEKGR